MSNSDPTTFEIGDIVRFPDGELGQVVAHGLPFEGWLLARSECHALNFDPKTGRIFGSQRILEMVRKGDKS